LCGTNYSIEFFCTFFDNKLKFESKTDELIIDISVDDLESYLLIPNLKWLIEMAKESLIHPNIYRVINE